MNEQQATSLTEQSAETPAAAGSASEAFSLELDNAWITIDNMVNGFFALTPKLVVASVVFVLFLIAAWLVKRAVMHVTRKHPSAHIGRVLGRLGQWLMIILGVMVAVAIVAPSVTPAKFLGALGIGSVAIGFAFKDVLQNFLAGILILLRQQFKVGDIIKFGDYQGVVQEIDTRLTIIETDDGNQVLVPNGQIYTNPITVLAAKEKRRPQIEFGSDYEEVTAGSNHKQQTSS